MPELKDISFTLSSGECVHLNSPIPINNILLQALTGRARIDAGAIWVNHQGDWLNLYNLSERKAEKINTQTIGYLGSCQRLQSQATVMSCVLEPLIRSDMGRDRSERQARHLLDWFGLPRRLWDASPKTLTVSELNQVNIACAFAVDYSVIIIDLPLKQLDLKSQAQLLQLIEFRKATGTCFIGNFDADGLREQVCDRNLSIQAPIPSTISNTAVHSY